jgi:CHAT domain-containing protein
MTRKFNARAARRLRVAVLEYLQASTPEQVRDCVARHPELLDDAAEAILLHFMDVAREEGRDSVLPGLTQCLQTLLRMRAERDARAGGDQASLRAELSEALADLPQVAAGHELRHRVSLLRRLLSRPDVRTNAELRALLQGVLGTCLVNLGEQTSASERDEAVMNLEAARSAHDQAPATGLLMSETVFLGRAYLLRSGGNPGADIEAAIRCFSEVLGVRDERLLAPHRDEAAIGLAESYLDRQSDDISDDIEHVIASCSLVLEADDGNTTASQAALARLLAGRAYLRRLAGRRADNVEQAIEHLSAAEVYTRQESPGWAGLQCDLGKAFQERIAGNKAENLTAAIRCFQAVIDYGAAVTDPRTRAVALNGLGWTYAHRMHGERERDQEAAIDCYRQASEILTEHGLTSELAAVLHGMGYAYVQRLAGNPADNVERAIGLFEDALAARILAGSALERAQTQHALANAYLRRRYGDRAHNVEQAISAFGEAQAAFASLGAARELAVTRESLAQGYWARVIGDREDNIGHAMRFVNLALAGFAEQGMTFEHVSSLTTLGNMLSEQPSRGEAGQADAIGCHQRAIEILGDGSARPDIWAGLHNNLGTAYLELPVVTQQDLTTAIACFDEALASGAAVRSPVEQAMTRHNLGLAYARRAGAADLAMAVTQLSAALEAFEAAGLSLYRRATGKELGDVCGRLGDWPSALGAYQVALRASDDLYLSSLRREAREAELAETPGLALRAGYAAAAAGELDEAVAIIERGRARATSEALARDTAELARIRAADDQLADEFTAAAAQVRELEATDLLAGGAGVADGMLVDRTGLSSLLGAMPRQRLEEARARLARAIGDIRRLAGHEQFLAQPGFDEVASVVKKAGPLAYLAVTDYGSLTLVVAGPPDETGRPGPTTWLVVEPAEPLTAALLGSHLIRGDGAEVTGGYLPAQFESGVLGRPFHQELSDLLPLLGDRLVGPLASHLTTLGTDAVTLVACGLLGLLPLHAATYQRDGEAGRRCLLDDVTISYAPSARVLGAAHACLAAADDRADWVLAGVGNPDAGSAPLRYARAELEQIAALFPTAITWYGQEATKAALIESLPRASHVHLACHAHFDPGSPRDSGVELAGRADDSPLTLAEIVAGRNFTGARLVVASACETAFIDFTSLPDEAIGLPAGFLQAGSAGVAGTLWKVQDLSTALLMTRFYEYLFGDDRDHAAPLGPAQALRYAQLWLGRVTRGELELYYEQHDCLRRARDEHHGGPAAPAPGSPARRPYEHPWYWAAFAFSGASRPPVRMAGQ